MLALQAPAQAKALQAQQAQAQAQAEALALAQAQRLREQEEVKRLLEAAAQWEALHEARVAGFRAFKVGLKEQRGVKPLTQ